MLIRLGNLWYQIVAWPIVDAPRFTKGQIATLVTGAASVGIAVAIVYCGRRWPPSLPQEGDKDHDQTYDIETGEQGEDKTAMRVDIEPVSSK